MNLKFISSRLLFTIVILIAGLVSFANRSDENLSERKEPPSIDRTLQTQFSMRTFAINRWNQSFVGAGTGQVTAGPFMNKYGENVAFEITTGDFLPSSEELFPEIQWRTKVSLLFGKLETEQDRFQLCQMFYSGLMYERDSLGKFFPNHRIELNNLGLKPYSFDEIEMNGDFRRTIKYPINESPQTLFRCSASAIFINSNGGFSPPYRTSLDWQYKKISGLIKAEISLSLINQ